MAWRSGKVSLGGLQDITGAVNKISESVKNIDSALGLEDKRDDEEGSGSRTSNSDRIGFFNSVMAFMGHNGEEDAAEGPEKPQSPKHSLTAEENHSVSTEPTTSKADASEVLGITQSPKQPSKLEENLSSSTESPVSKPDVSEQSVTPQTPTHPSATEEKHGGSTESPTSKGGGFEVSETPQFPTHPSTTQENHSSSIEIINSIEKENRDNQDTKYPVPDDEDLPTQLGESDRDIPDDRASSSPTKLDQPSVMETTVSIQAGKEDTDDGNASQSQPARSIHVLRHK